MTASAHQKISQTGLHRRKMGEGEIDCSVDQGLALFHTLPVLLITMICVVQTGH